MAARRKARTAVTTVPSTDANAAADILTQLGLSFSMQNGSNRYALYDELGRGGVGLVYFGMDKALHRPVAVKILRKRFLKDKGAVAHFLSEAKITACLDHPGIVPVYDVGYMESGELFFAMERVDGRTLRQILNERTSNKDVQRSMSDLVAIFGQVCQIVAYAHSRGIVHRDLKPDNIMVGEFNTVFVMDWGISRDLNEQKRRSVVRKAKKDPQDITALLNARKVKGTPRFMSPEQALGVSDVDFRSDVFSLGLILYETLAGRHPFEDDSMRKMMHNIKQKPTPTLSSYFIANELKSICYKALEKLPENRYPSAKLLAKDVQNSLSYRHVSVHRDNPLIWSWKLFRRHMVLSLVSMFVLAIGVVGYSYRRSNLKYSNELLELADKRMESAHDWENRIIDVQSGVATSESGMKQRTVAILRERKNTLIVSARALFSAAMKKHANEFSPRQIEAFKDACISELAYQVRLRYKEGILATLEEMEEEGILRDDNQLMQWTPDELSRIESYRQFAQEQKVADGKGGIQDIRKQSSKRHSPGS